MLENREAALAWIVQEEGGQWARNRADEYWATLLLGMYPSGLDYFMLDTAYVCSPGVALQWLSISLEAPVYLSVAAAHDRVYALSSERSALLVSQMCFSRRRRHKTEAGWRTHGQAKTNRVNRVHSRALKLTATPFEVMVA